MIAVRYAGIQTRLQQIGTSGCHFLALCSIAEEVLGRKIDLIDTVNLTFDKHLVDTEYYVLDNCAVLHELTGLHWTQKSCKTLPAVIKDNQYTEVIYKNPRTNQKHYRRRSVDTLINSVTVEEGIILEYRIYEHD